MSGTLNYNEKKVQKNMAELLTVENYPLDKDYLTFQHKLNRLENQAALNKNVTSNSVHISLNFDTSERLEKEQLVAIANTYMEKIGFGEQPYLVYQHFDAGHPHIHIVSVKVRPDGSRVDTQNIGKNQSEKARKEIEIAFNLVKAEDSKQKEKYKLEPISAEKVRYGKMQTKGAISNVLKTVIDSYKYSSIHELNALLRLYNVMADRGSEHSKMYRSNGLMYRILDEQGNKIGAPIKASQFYMKPTMKKLEEKFKQNEGLKNPHLVRIKNAIDLALLQNPNQSLHALMKALQREGIATVLRQNDTGRIYGITYIDHKTKVVFNGSDLGKQYSAKAMQARCSPNPSQETKSRQQLSEKIQGEMLPGKLKLVTDTSLTDALLKEEYTGETLPFDLRKNKKKKRQGFSIN